jgi:hypothetical protein
MRRAGGRRAGDVCAVHGPSPGSDSSAAASASSSGGLEVESPVCDGARQAADRRGACGGNAEVVEVCAGERLGAGEEPRAAALADRRSVPRDQTRGERARRDHADRLAEHRTHGQLEAAARAGHAQAGCCGHPAREQRIVAEVAFDRERVGVEVEGAPHAPDDRRQRADRGAYWRASLFAPQIGDRSSRAFAERDGAAVASPRPPRAGTARSARNASRCGQSSGGR